MCFLTDTFHRKCSWEALQLLVFFCASWQTLSTERILGKHWSIEAISFLVLPDRHFAQKVFLGSIKVISFLCFLTDTFHRKYYWEAFKLLAFLCFLTETFHRKYSWEAFKILHCLCLLSGTVHRKYSWEPLKQLAFCVSWHTRSTESILGKHCSY